MGTRRCHPYPETEFPAFLTDGKPRKWRPIEAGAQTPVFRGWWGDLSTTGNGLEARSPRSRHDRQALLILLVAIIGVLAYWRGHVDGSHAEREARAMHAGVRQ